MRKFQNERRKRSLETEERWISCLLSAFLQNLGPKHFVIVNDNPFVSLAAPVESSDISVRTQSICDAKINIKIFKPNTPFFLGTTSLTSLAGQLYTGKWLNNLFIYKCDNMTKRLRLIQHLEIYSTRFKSFYCLSLTWKSAFLESVSGDFQCCQ